MELKLLDKNNEKILIVVFYGQNRNDEVTLYHQKVCKKLKIPVNYVQFPFEQGYNHAHAVDWFIKETAQFTDYWIFLDNDSIPLREDFVDIYYSKMMDKETLVGMSGQSNHVIKQNGNYDHPYAYTAGMGLSKQLYIKLGFPSFQANYEGDTGESLTWAVERKGFNLSLFWPKSTGELTKEECQKHNIDYKHRKSAVGQHWFGFGTTYGQDLFYHQFCAPIERSKTEFINKCKEILGENKKIEAVIVCKDYSDCLDITLSENSKYFDNIVVVTDSEDTKTQEVCKKYSNVSCWYFTEWNKNGSKFNKGGALNYGIQNLKYKDWVVFLDSDIVIKEDFRNKLTDKEKFYGSYRRFIPTHKDYQRLIQYPNNQDLRFSYECIEGSGCGFFQCVNLNSKIAQLHGLNNLYKDSYSAEQVDIDFLKLWCPLVEHDPNLVRSNIELWHLGPHGTNHEGRVTSFFGE